MIVGHYSLGTLILAPLRDSRKGKSWVSLFPAIKLVLRPEQHMMVLEPLFFYKVLRKLTLPEAFKVAEL